MRLSWVILDRTYSKGRCLYKRNRERHQREVHVKTKTEISYAPQATEYLEPHQTLEEARKYSPLELAKGAQLLPTL